MDQKFLSPYNHAGTEDRIYKLWEDSGVFNPDVCIEKGYTKRGAPIFSIVLPPPNVTGVLHMGSALMLAIEDTMVRFARMKGMRALWIPGTDSAAIATQARVEKDIQNSEGKSRHDLGREELLRRIDAFVAQNKHTMLLQMRSMGASLDWTRYAYTMDESRQKAVMTAFVRMYEAGLVYRGNRIVNWDPKGQTTISDDEVVYEERDAKLYTFKYSKDFPISISTTRPETKVGDTAVAVHPDDERYKKFVGKEYDVVFCDVPLHIKIVADQSVEKDFGTGALGVTPAHSHIDWEISERHALPRPQVINEYAKMTVSGRLSGLKVADARGAVVKWLEGEGLLEKEEDVKQSVSTAERTGGIVEPLPKLQWWVSVEKEFTIPHSEIPGIPSGSKTTLKQLMLAAVESGATSFVSERFEKNYVNWVRNLRDWCISRQIWFGHRIPVWHKDGKVRVGISSPGEGWEQDPDVLDTWFSSSLWTFSTLGWPEETDDLKTYHPTTIIETGYDIIPLWVSRMVLMSSFFLGQVPFRTVFIHGIVRDGAGRKISKSLGNNIDPVDMAKQYGMDAVRISLLMGTAPGTDSKISEEKIRGYKKYANKIWNIARFIISSSEETDLVELPSLANSHQKLVDEFHELKAEITKLMEEHKLHLAAEKLYQYTWTELADVIIESQKAALSGPPSDERASSQWMLRYILENLLKLQHPFMPFITEEIWQSLPGERGPLIVTAWPGK